jgi:hypothetical protein
MFALYIFAAILGGGLLLIGMLGGEADGGDVVGVDMELGSQGAGWKHAFSFQAAAYALAAFGLTGSLLSWLGTPGPLTLLASAVMAVAGGALVGLVFSWLKRNQGGFSEPSEHYIGGIGRAEIRIPSDGRGRIELVHRGRSFTLPAVSTGGEIDRYETVVILDVIDGVAHVDRAPKELML